MEPIKSYRYTVEIHADPQPKGRPRFRYGPNGIPITYTPKGTRIYETLIQDVIEDQLPEEVFDSPIAVRIICYLKRPDSHYTKKGVLKPSAPKYPTSPRCGDADNLAKAVLDAAQSSELIKDDRFCCDLYSIKRWADECEPRVILSIEPLP